MIDQRSVECGGWSIGGAVKHGEVARLYTGLHSAHPGWCWDRQGTVSGGAKVRIARRRLAHEQKCCDDLGFIHIHALQASVWCGVLRNI